MLHYNTVSNLLRDCLLKLMAAEEFLPFRLVGGTALSLQLGHRMSVDIDMFTDDPYGSVDFKQLALFLKKTFAYVDHLSLDNPAMGVSFSIGTDRDNSVKLDVYYCDKFVAPAVVIDSIRMATIEDIIAMKIDVVQRGGRKKDFWDLHELLDKYALEDMIGLHKSRYEYVHDRNLIIRQLTDYAIADDDFEPICLRGKYWQFIKEDIEDAVKGLTG